MVLDLTGTGFDPWHLEGIEDSRTAFHSAPTIDSMEFLMQFSGRLEDLKETGEIWIIFKQVLCKCST